MKFQNYEAIVEFFKEHNTYLDTNAILNPGFNKLMTQCLKVLIASGKNLYVSAAVVNEIKSLCESDYENTAKTAKERLAAIELLILNNVIKLVGKPKSTSLSTQHQIKIAIKYRKNNNLAFITCNRKLSQDLLMQNSLKSFDGNHIHVFNISKNGYLFDYEDSNFDSRSNSENLPYESACRKFFETFGLK